VAGRGDSGDGDDRRPRRKWGSRSGGGPIRPAQPPQDRTRPVERTRPLDRRYDDDRYPPERYPAERHPSERHREERYRDEGHRDEGYRDDGYRDRRPRYEDDHDDRRYPEERYERPPARRYRDEDGRRADEWYHPDDDRSPDERWRRSGRYPDPEDRPEGRREPAPVRRTAGGGRGPTPGAGPAALPPAPPVTPPTPPKKLTVTRVAAQRTSYLSKKLMRSVGEASRAQGAGETGLTSLIWLNAVNMAADAMIAVCLAGTIFFSAATSQQRGNVALYLLITMAPFALIAPVIGPVLDRMHHGRRWALAGTLLGRAVLAYIMAVNFHGLALYPAAFGALVLAKAYGVLRAAAVPRVMPEQLTLVSANARLSIFGLCAAGVAGVFLGVLIKISGSYPAALWVTSAVFAAGAVLAVRLPKHVDSPDEGAAPERLASPGGKRGRLTLGNNVVLALRATAAIRGLNGFLTLFMVFLIQTRLHGVTAAVELGAIVVGAGAGSMVGTTLGARLRLARPDVVVIVAIGVSAGTCVLAAVSYSIQSAVLLALVVGAANSLAKLALDAMIQREVPDYLAASAFARSETLLQLAWVFGGGLGIVLPSRGTIGFSVAAALLVGAFASTLAGRRSAARATPRLGTDGQPAA
jgi:Major Facilitator Superfamily